MRAALATILAVLLLAGAGGCGGASHSADNRYVDAVNQAQSDFAMSFDRLASKITATSTPQQDVKTLEGFRAAVAGAVARLHAIRPPARVAGLHQQLVQALRSYEDALARAEGALANSDPQQVIAAETGLTSAVTKLSAKINSAINAINTRLRG